MNKFSWFEAKTVEEALEKVNATVSQTLAPRPPQSPAVFKAGGIDLLDLMKEGLSQPEMLISIKNLPGLDKITSDASGLRIGANVTLSELEDNSDIQSKYLALHQAVAHAGTPQLRNSATLGGNLAQRTRCWYFRSIDHQCFRKGSGTCYAQKGENLYHAIFNNASCASVHSSSIATALMAFNSRVEILSPGGKKREVPLAEFFVHPETDSRTENILTAKDLISAVLLPPVKNNTKSSYLKQGARESHDWAIADVAVVAEMNGNTCLQAEIVLGAAAPVPMKAVSASASLKGVAINEKTAIKAGDLAVKGATPLPGNGYKVPIFKTIVKRAILNLV